MKREEREDRVAEAMAQAVAGAMGASRSAEIHAVKTKDGELRMEASGANITLMAMSVDIVKRIKDGLSDNRMVQTAYLTSVVDYCMRWLGQMAAGVTDEDDNTEKADD